MGVGGGRYVFIVTQSSRPLHNANASLGVQAGCEPCLRRRSASANATYAAFIDNSLTPPHVLDELLFVFKAVVAVSSEAEKKCTPERPY